MIKYLSVFFVSMLPLAELRVAVPLGIGMGLDIIWVYLLSILGNMLPVPIIYIFAREFLLWGKDKEYIGGFFTFCLEKGEKAGEKLKSKAGKGFFWALFFFIGVPIPGTGAWTGILAASILKIDFRTSVLASICGVLLAGVIMGLASAGIFGAL